MELWHIDWNVDIWFWRWRVRFVGGIVFYIRGSRMREGVRMRMRMRMWKMERMVRGRQSRGLWLIWGVCMMRGCVLVVGLARTKAWRRGGEGRGVSLFWMWMWEDVVEAEGEEWEVKQS
jgi:hypothetical protein